MKAWKPPPMSTYIYTTVPKQKAKGHTSGVVPGIDNNTRISIIKKQLSILRAKALEYRGLNGASATQKARYDTLIALTEATMITAIEE